MAKMLPAVVAVDTPSRAEIRLFEKIRTDLSDEWTALHSIGLGIHERKPWAEIDFVLVGPLGVFCLEVKGGGVSRTDGIWVTRNNDGVFRLKESPFKQAGGASSALHRYLANNLTGTDGLLVGYGVVFPDIQFLERGIDVINQVVFDSTDSRRPMQAYLERVARYWTDHVPGNRVLSRVDASLRRSIVQCLCKDFDLRPRLGVQVNLAEEELIRWTDRQQRILSAIRDNERIIVRGGAGTGKTCLAVEEARRLAADGKRVLLTCFNKELARSLSPIAADRPGLEVRHLHSLMRRIIDEGGRRNAVPNAQEADLFEVFFPQIASEVLLERPTPPFDAIVVDEGQDLLKDSFVDVIDAALLGGLQRGTWRLFIDPNQAIFGQIGQSQLSRWLAGSPTQLRLSENCRNTPPIAASAAQLSSTRMEEVLCRQGPAVDREFYDSADELVDLLADTLRRWIDQGLAPSQVVLLSASPCDVDWLKARLGERRVKIAAFPTSDHTAVPLATVSLFKGLEAPAVVLFGLRDLLNREGAMQAYVGQTRARSLLSVFLPRDQKEGVRQRSEEFGRLLVSQSRDAAF